MQKTYVAVTRGVLPKVEGQLTDFLLRDGKTNTSRVVDRKTPGSEESFAGLQDTVGTDNGSETVFGGNPSAYRPPPSDPGTVCPRGNVPCGG